MDGVRRCSAILSSSWSIKIHLLWQCQGPFIPAAVIMGMTWSGVSICVHACSTKFSSAGFQDSALSMLSTHACGARRRKGARAPLGLVVHENMIQGNRSKNCIALTRVTRVYCLHHSRESVLRPVLVFLEEDSDHVSCDTGDTSAASHLPYQKLPPNLLPLIVISCPACGISIRPAWGTSGQQYHILIRWLKSTGDGNTGRE